MLLIAVLMFVLRAAGVPLKEDLAVLSAFSVVAYVLFDISLNTYSYSRNRLYPQDTDLLPNILNWIEEKGAREAHLIQYSGQSVKVIVRKLLEKGAAVSLWLEDPNLAVSSEQKDRITSSIAGFPGELKVSGQCCLTSFFYQVPGSIRGILIDRKLLVIGNYTHEHVLEPNVKYPNDKVEISGHDCPTWILYEGTPEFRIMRDIFESQLRNFRDNQRQNNLPPALELPIRANKSNAADS
jgi:hypothetical protein